MPRAGKEAETPDPVSIHVNTRCTTTQLCNYNTEGKAATKTTPTTAGKSRYQNHSNYSGTYEVFLL